MNNINLNDIRVLIKRPNERAEVKRIPNTYNEFERIVGGYPMFNLKIGNTLCYYFDTQDKSTNNLNFNFYNFPTIYGAVIFTGEDKFGVPCDITFEEISYVYKLFKGAM